MAQAGRGCGALNRRGALLLPSAALVVILLPSYGIGAEPGGLPQAEPLLAILGSLVIPPTATPGAGDASVVAFVSRAFAHGMDGTSADSLDVLAHALDARARGAFMHMDVERQREALSALDGDAYPAATPAAKTWRIVKGLILAGYYTSETGCTRELAYDLPPGRWDNDIPLKPGDRAIANDWFAVSFR